MNDVDDFIERHEEMIRAELDKAELMRIIGECRWKVVPAPAWADPNKKPPIIDEGTGAEAPVSVIANTLPPGITSAQISWQETLRQMERIMELCKRTNMAIMIKEGPPPVRHRRR